MSIRSNSYKDLRSKKMKEITPEQNEESQKKEFQNYKRKKIISIKLSEPLNMNAIRKQKENQEANLYEEKKPDIKVEEEIKNKEENDDFKVLKIEEEKFRVLKVEDSITQTSSFNKNPIEVPIKVKLSYKKVKISNKIEIIKIKSFKKENFRNTHREFYTRDPLCKCNIY